MRGPGLAERFVMTDNLPANVDHREPFGVWGVQLATSDRKREVMKKRIVLGLSGLFVMAGLSAPTVAWAQATEGTGGGVVYKKKTVLSFEDDTIDGSLTSPDQAYIESRKRLRHSSLIRIRENFREKILGSVINI